MRPIWMQWENMRIHRQKIREKWNIFAFTKSLCSSGPSDRYRNPVRSGPVCGLGSVSRWSRSGSVRRKIFRRRENFEKKVRSDAIVFVKKSSKSEPSSRFLSRLKFWKIRAPLFGEFGQSSQDLGDFWLQFDQIPGRSAEFTKKWHMDFSSCHVMVWWYDEMMVWWYDDMTIWWYDDIMILWW